MTDCCQVTTTWPDQVAAEQAGAILVEERLAACAQVLGPLRSTYLWQGSIEQGEEWYCHLKTTLELVPRVIQRIRELHRYDVPEIIALPIVAADKSYLEWIRAELRT